MKLPRSMLAAWFVAPWFVAGLLGCGAPASRSVAPDARLASTTGPTSLATLASSPITVLVFVAAHCPVQRAHAARLAALAERFPSVRFLGVASEVDTSLADAAVGVPFPVVRDEGAALATALHVEFATHAVVLGGPDAASSTERLTVRFSGGLDGDAARLSPSSPPYLADALTDVLARGPVRTATSEPMGCPLRLR